MQNLFLVLHLAGAGLTLLLMGGALGALLAQRTQQYRPLAVSLALGGVWQLVTGVGLALASSTGLASVCARLALYLAVVSATEAALMMAMRRGARTVVSQ